VVFVTQPLLSPFSVTSGTRDILLWALKGRFYILQDPLWIVSRLVIVP
jgi:hypothetical protein